MRRINFRISMVACVCVALAPVLSSASTATLSFPLPSSIRVGQQITTPLKVNVTNGDLGGVLVDVVYDPKAISILADSDISGVNENFMCTANTHYSLSAESTSRVACVTGFIGVTGALTLANVIITGVGIKQGPTSVHIIPRSFVTSIDPLSELTQPSDFSLIPSAITRQISVKNRR